MPLEPQVNAEEFATDYVAECMSCNEQSLPSLVGGRTLSEATRGELMWELRFFILFVALRVIRGNIDDDDACEGVCLAVYEALEDSFSNRDAGQLAALVLAERWKEYNLHLDGLEGEPNLWALGQAVLDNAGVERGSRLEIGMFIVAMFGHVGDSVHEALVARGLVAG